MGQDAQGVGDRQETTRVVEAWEWRLKREMLVAALDELRAAQLRIAALEAQVQALKDEIRRYTRAKVE